MSAILYRSVLLAIAASSGCLLACDSSAPGADSGIDGSVEAATDALARCERDVDCVTDAQFCVVWRCMPGAGSADTRGCVDMGSPCADGVVCDEDDDRCIGPAWCLEATGECLAPGDCDGDGSLAEACGGPDCDDADALRFPAATELCDAERRDEDCDPTTLGDVDADGDGEVSAACCNGENCGSDCDDSRRSVFSGADESCNAVDDDCDGRVDESGAFCPVGICRDTRCESPNWERVYLSNASRVSWTRVGPDGAVYVAVETGDDLDGDGTPEPHDPYLVAYGPDGRYRWHRGLERSIAAAPDGTLVSLVDVGGDAHFERISATDGSRIEILPVPFAPGEAASPQVLHIAGDDVFVGSLAGSGADRRLILSRIDSTLTRTLDSVVIRGIGSDGFEGENRAFVLAASDAGVVVGTSLAIAQTVGGGTLPSGRFVASFTKTLTLAWTAEVSNVVFPDGLAVSDDGYVAVSGHYEGRFVAPWGEIWPTPNGSSGAFASVFAPDGSHHWTDRHDGPGTDVVWGVSFDARGNVVLSGGFSGAMDVTPLGALAVARQLLVKTQRHVDAEIDAQADEQNGEGNGDQIKLPNRERGEGGEGGDGGRAVAGDLD